MKSLYEIFEKVQEVLDSYPDTIQVKESIFIRKHEISFKDNLSLKLKIWYEEEYQK